jgi:hypothetical protein
VVGVFLFSFSTANNQTFGSRFVPSSSPFPQVHVYECKGWSRAGGESYDSVLRPNPWRPVASAVVAPTSLPPSISFNNFMVQIEVSPLLDLDLGDMWMDLSTCYLKVFTSEMQQVRIWAIICLPFFVMVGKCGLSVPCLLCTAKWSKCGWSTSKIVELSKVLQEKFLHMRSRHTSPVSYFSAQSVAVKREARRHGTDDFAQEMVIWLEAFWWHHDCLLIYQISAVVTNLLMISDKWYAKLNRLYVFISEILDVSFQHVVFAARCLEYQNLDYLPSVNSWSQVNNTVVHTQHFNFRSSTNLGFAILQLQIDLNANASVNLESMASTITRHEQHFFCCFCCTCLSLPDDRHVEDAVSLLFGLCHRRWMTTPPLLIPRFNGRDTLSLSSVKVIRYLQLNSTPRVHIPDRPLGEPPAGHQLDRTSFEALEDYRCGNFESELSADERTSYGSICDLRRLLHVFRSPHCHVVHLGIFSCSTMESHVLLYHDP